MRRYLVSTISAGLATFLVLGIAFLACWLRGQTFEQVMGFSFHPAFVAFLFLSAWFYGLIILAAYRVRP